MDERFTVLRLLHEGGAAYIYLVTDGCKMYVVKKSLANIKSRQQCLQEWVICQDLSPHENILPIEEAWYSNQQAIEIDGSQKINCLDNRDCDVLLLMDYVKINLYDYNHRHISNLPIKTIIKIVTDIAKGLAHIHKNNIIHRDIKPENIMLCDGCPKIIDFGYAVQLPTKEDRIVGTAEYIAPEVYSSSQYTTSVDMYALGVILYELLTKFTPYHDVNIEAVKRNVIVNNRKYEHLLPNNESLKLLIDGLISQPLIVSKPELRLTASQVINYTYQI